jgi:hypothetical protein
MILSQNGVVAHSYRTDVLIGQDRYIRGAGVSLQEETMSHEQIPLVVPDDGEMTSCEERMESVFTRFGAENYALVPHTNRQAQWLFRHIWLIPFLLLILEIAIVLLAIFTAEEVKMVFALYRLPQPVGELCDGRREYRYEQEERQWVGMSLRCRIPVKNVDEGIDKAISTFPAEWSVAISRPQLFEEGMEEGGTDSFVVVEGFSTKKEWMAYLLGYLTVAYIIPIGLSLTIAGFLAVKLQKTVPKSLYELVKAGRLKPAGSRQRLQLETGLDVTAPEQGEHSESDSSSLKQCFRIRPRSWQTYVDDFEQALNSPWRYVHFGFWLIVGYSLAYVIGRQGAAFTSGVLWSYLYLGVILVIGPALLVYIAAFGVWFLIIVATYIRWLTPAFELDIQPGHGDGCGGLKRLGGICFAMATATIPPAIGVGFWWFSGVLRDVTISSGITITAVIASAALLVVATFAFFLPLWHIHKEMSRDKARLQDEAVSRIAPVERRLRDLVGQGKLEDAETRQLEIRLEKLHQLYPSDLKYPTWPFNSGILLAFWTSQIVPIITIIAGVFEFTDLLK